MASSNPGSVLTSGTNTEIISSSPSSCCGITSSKGSYGMAVLILLVLSNIHGGFQNLGQVNDLLFRGAEFDEANNTFTNSRTTEEHDANENMDLHPDYDYEFIKFEDAKERFPLPDWLENFLKTQPVAIHNDTLSDPDAKFIVLTCHKFKETVMELCGGLTDRLFLLPYALFLAHKTGRKLLIKYSKPAPLEHFLIPPSDGFDWRLPDGYLDAEWEAYGNRTRIEMRDQRRYVWMHMIDKEPWVNEKVIFMNNNLGIPRTSLIQDQIFDDTTVDGVWPGIFRRMFQPSRNVSQAMASVTETYGLRAGEYASAHVRARAFDKTLKYNAAGRHGIMADKVGGGLLMSDNDTREKVALLGDNAVQCAVRVMPDTEFVYVASDSPEIVNYLKKESLLWADNDTKKETLIASWSGSQDDNSTDPTVHGWGVSPWQVPTSARVIARPDYWVEAFHFDSTVAENPADVYPTFIDLWIMSHAKCHAMGVGGYGRFGSVLSGNHETCASRHRDYDSLSPSCATPVERKKWKAGHPIEEKM
jgi:hypothetical protein